MRSLAEACRELTREVQQFSTAIQVHDERARTPPHPPAIDAYTSSIYQGIPHDRLVRLSDPEMAESMQQLIDRARRDPAYGRAVMREAGILDDKGQITATFGG